MASLFKFPKRYDVIVVGAGHAGVEAALAAARMGCETLLLTMNLDTLAQMSCNPAVGGLAKGHIVREIDALGGEMAINTDMTGIQFRVLNTKKGPSVQAPRAQCDKKAYQFRMKHVCEQQERLDLKQAQVVDLIVEKEQIRAVVTMLGTVFEGETVVVTGGTFLRGLLHVGMVQIPGGRFGEEAAGRLSEALKRIGLELGRFKTGTPPRLHARSINWERLQEQRGDEPPPFFSHWVDEMFHVEHCSPRSEGRYPPGSLLDRLGRQLPCYITWTTEKTAQVIRENLHLSPLYSGVIKGIGPRYCPSIEDKIVRFADKPRHLIFLEPEGVQTEEVYVNGFSTSLPFEVQVQMVRTIEGCEDAEIVRPAYAVEYDYVPPTQLYPWLETKCCRNLFLAGQINGTSGYEEAAGQGIVAGINAALRVQGKPPFVLRRDQAYIGVLIDDLVTKGTNEPYRMFTSRAEYRLLLRQDNADDRLCPVGYQLGLLPKHRYERYLERRRMIDEELKRLSETKVGPQPLIAILKRPEVSYFQLPGARRDLPETIARKIETEVKYAGYIDRQLTEVEKFKQLESRVIPEDFDYDSIPGLRVEARQKLKQIRPRTIGQAARISGVNPADISLLLVWLRRKGASVNAGSAASDEG